MIDKKYLKFLNNAEILVLREYFYMDDRQFKSFATRFIGSNRDAICHQVVYPELYRIYKKLGFIK